jgi:hypothetical protein
MMVPGVRGKVEGSINHFHEASFFTKDKVLRLYHCGILTRFRICFQACPVGAFLALMLATREVGFRLGRKRLNSNAWLVARSFAGST